MEFKLTRRQAKMLGYSIEHNQHLHSWSIYTRGVKKRFGYGYRTQLEALTALSIGKKIKSIDDYNAAVARRFFGNSN